MNEINNIAQEYSLLILLTSVLSIIFSLVVLNKSKAREGTRIIINRQDEPAELELIAEFRKEAKKLGYLKELNNQIVKHDAPITIKNLLICVDRARMSKGIEPRILDKD